VAEAGVTVAAGEAGGGGDGAQVYAGGVCGVIRLAVPRDFSTPRHGGTKGTKGFTD